MPDLPRLYRWLLKLYPAGFREEYQTPMERQFRDEYREAEGPAARTRLWLNTLRDVAASAPPEIAREPNDETGGIDGGVSNRRTGLYASRHGSSRIRDGGGHQAVSPAASKAGTLNRLPAGRASFRSFSA
jgi:hypothetical protein